MPCFQHFSVSIPTRAVLYQLGPLYTHATFCVTVQPVDETLTAWPNALQVCRLNTLHHWHCHLTMFSFPAG
jgi:hypothetical protein